MELAGTYLPAVSHAEPHKKFLSFILLVSIQAANRNELQQRSRECLMECTRFRCSSIPQCTRGGKPRLIRAENERTAHYVQCAYILSTLSGAPAHTLRSIQLIEKKKNIAAVDYVIYSTMWNDEDSMLANNNNIIQKTMKRTSFWLLIWILLSC